MSRHAEPTDETRERAALYVLGSLGPAEAVEFEGHLRQGCAACQAEVRSFAEVTAELGLAAVPVDPPAGLGLRLLARVREAGGAKEAAPKGILLSQAGVLIARSEDMPWQPQGSPGVSIKVLFTDTARKYITALGRMDPGTQYPRHRHADIEEIYLLEGDLIVEGHAMQPGDYCRAEPDSIHGETRTEGGCLFLMMCSQQDELLAGPA